MLIKFKENDSWVIFGEIDHIIYEEANRENEDNSSEKDHPLFFRAATGDTDALKMKLDFFTKNMSEATVIFAYSPIYLMNDNGRTIETI